MEELILNGLLIIALIFAVLLILISTATVGRKMSDLEFIEEAKINGIRKIQCVINLRTHINRTFLGAVLVVITILLLADAPLILRTWTNRILFAMVMMSYAISSAMDWVDERKQLQILQTRERGGRDRAFAAGVKQAEGDAAAVLVRSSDTSSSVDVVTIQPEAAQSIADAVRPSIAEKTDP